VRKRIFFFGSNYRDMFLPHRHNAYQRNCILILGVIVVLLFFYVFINQPPPLHDETKIVIVPEVYSSNKEDDYSAYAKYTKEDPLF